MCQFVLNVCDVGELDPKKRKELTDYLEHERSLGEFLEDFPSVTREDAIAALEEARTSLTATLK